MSLSVAQARDEMTNKIATVWPVGIPLFFDDLPGEVPASSTPWGRLTIRHSGGEQGSLSDASAKKRFVRTGTLIVQIFTPNGGGLSTADEYVKIILDAFEGTSNSGGVWFRNARFREIGSDGDFFQTNVTVDFQYDEIK